MRKVVPLKKKAAVAVSAVEEETASAEPEWLEFCARPRILALVVFVISIALYANTVTHDFTFDDFAAVVHNPYVAGDHLPISSLMKLDFWGTPTSSSLSHKSFRPLCSLLYRFLWRIRVSDSPAMVFHLAEVVLNAVCSALAVLLVIGPLCKTAPLTKIIASLLYAVHPAKTEAVAGVVGMAEILSALFFFAAVYLFSEKQSVILAGLSCFLASMCKETGVTSALVVAVIGFSRRRYIGSVVVVAIAVTMFVMTRVVAFGRDSWTIEPSPQDNPMMMHRGLLYLINAAWVQTKYIQILFWPANLTCDYSFNAMPLITSLGDVRILVAVIASSGVAWLLWRAVVKGDRPLLFASAWYVAPMLPATHLVGVIGTLVAERLLYVPALGWALLVGEGCRRAVRKQPVLAKIIVLVLLVACCGALGARTVERNADWKNNDVLFDRTLAVVPNSLKAIMNIAGRSFVAADWKNVLVMTDRAMQVDPKYCHAMQIKGRALLELADDPKAALPVLMQCYDCMRVKRHSSQLMAEVLELIGKSHMTMKNYEEAIPWFRKGIETGFPDANCNLAVTLITLRRFEESLEPARVCAYEGSLAHRLSDQPSRRNASLKLTNLAIVFQNLKRFDEMEATLNEALRVDPTNAERVADMRSRKK